MTSATATPTRCRLGHRYDIVEGHGVPGLKPIGQTVGSAVEAVEFMERTDPALDPRLHASHINGTACPEETARLTAEYAEEHGGDSWELEAATNRLMSALWLDESMRDTVRDALQDAYDAGREAATHAEQTGTENAR